MLFEWGGLRTSFAGVYTTPASGKQKSCRIDRALGAHAVVPMASFCFSRWGSGRCIVSS